MTDRNAPDPFEDDDLLDNAHGVTASETLRALEWRTRNGTLTNADRKDAEMLLARAASAHTLDQEDAYVTAARPHRVRRSRRRCGMVHDRARIPRGDCFRRQRDTRLSLNVPDDDREICSTLALAISKGYNPVIPPTHSLEP